MNLYLKFVIYKKKYFSNKLLQLIFHLFLEIRRYRLKSKFVKGAPRSPEGNVIPASRLPLYVPLIPLFVLIIETFVSDYWIWTHKEATSKQKP